MARLDAKWYNFSQRGKIWFHFWQDTPAAGGAVTYTYAGTTAITSGVSAALSKGKVAASTTVITSDVSAVYSYSRSYVYASTITIVSTVGGFSSKGKVFSSTTVISSTVPSTYSFSKVYTYVSNTHFVFTVPSTYSFTSAGGGFTPSRLTIGLKLGIGL